MRSLLSAIDAVSVYCGRAVGQFYMVAALLTFYEVVMRYLFNAPTIWAFEVVMLLCAIAWMMSAGYVTQQKKHISITILYAAAPRPAQWALDLFSNIIGLAAVGTLAYASWPLARDAWTMHELTGSPFNSPEPMILKGMLFAGACMYALQLVVNLIRNLQTYGEWR